MEARAIVLALTLIAVGLTGCLGSDGDDIGRTDLQRPAPTVTAETGAIEGVVTDNAVQAVPDATVRIAELDGVSTATLDDGSYVINDVPPGTYSLVVEKDGFVPASEPVQVRAEQVATVDFIVVHLQSDDAYRQSMELNGFMACGVAAGWNASVLPEPPSPVPDLRASGLAWTICEDVDFATNNGTADQTYWEITLDAPMHTMVYEVVWDAGHPLISEMLAIGGFAFDGDQLSRWKYESVDIDGESPLTTRLDRAYLEQVQQDFLDRCDEGDDTYCGYSFFDEGWEFSTAVLPNNYCVADEASACGAFEQTFTLYITGFYNAPAPTGWAISNGATG